MFSVTCSLLLTNEVWSKVIISQVSVRPQGGGGRDRPPWTDTPQTETPSGQRLPSGQRSPWTETPLDRDPLWTQTPSGHM